MNSLWYVLTGGFLSGYRTKILGWLALLYFVLNTVVGWAVGDMSFVQMLQTMQDKLPGLLTGLGLLAAAAHAESASKK